MYPTASVQRRLLSLVVAAGIGLVACKGGSSSPAAPTPAAPTSAPTPPPTSFDGNWSGTTSQSLPITFTVSSNVVTAISVQVRATYGGSACLYTTGSQERPTVTNGSFSLAIGGGTVSTRLTASFSSSTAATGAIEAHSISGLVCGSTVVIGTPLSQSASTWQAARS